MRFFVEIDDYDYKRLVELLKQAKHLEKGVKSFLVDVAGLLAMPKKDELLVKFLNSSWVKQKLDKLLQKKKFNEFIQCNLHAKEIKDRDVISVLLDVEISDYERAEHFIRDKIHSNKNKYVNCFGIPALTVINNTLARDIKEQLIINLVNECATDIGKLLEEFLQKKYDFCVKIESIRAEIE